MDNKLNFAFFGTPDVAAETLDILKSHGYVPSLIITSPDARAGRKMLLTPPPAKIWAQKNNIPFLQPENNEELGAIFATSAQADAPSKAIREHANMRESKNGAEFDLFIVVAYGKIIPEKILNHPKFGSLNIHYSLLPKYRGASPVESAILNGDSETGITIQKMAYKMDAGPILTQKKVEIIPDETAPGLRKRLIKIGGELLAKILPDFVAGNIEAVPQDEAQVTIAKKIKKGDGLIDVSGDPIKNYNKFRAYAHWPRTFFFKNSKRVIITDAVLLNGEFKIKKVLPEGRKEVTWEEFNRI